MIGFSIVFWLTSMFACAPCQSLCEDMADLAEACDYDTEEMINANPTGRQFW